MHRRHCLNCETAWHSVADHELDGPHVCPSCGDQLVPTGIVELGAHGPSAALDELTA